MTRPAERGRPTACIGDSLVVDQTGLTRERSVMAANVSAVSDVPEPGAARRRHVRRLSPPNLHETICGGKAARTRGRCAK